MNKIFFKGLFMVLAGLIGTSISTSGIPADKGGYIILFISLIGTTIGYFGQSFIIPTTSKLWVLDWWDAIKTILLGAGNLLSSSAAMYYVQGHVDYPAIIKGIVTVCALYVGKQFSTNSSGVFMKGE